MPRPRWARPARVPPNGSWPRWACSTAPRRVSKPCRDVSYGGVLCAPGLIENGLLRHLDQALPTLSGYYTSMHVLLLLAYLALCRIKTVEQLQYEPPGELGKLLGLDRVPEVRCLRKKLASWQAGMPPRNGPDCSAGTGWRPLRNWPARCTSMDTCVCITASKPSFRGVTWPASGCACAARPITGSTTPWGNRFSPSSGRSTTACWRPCGATWCRVYCATFLASRAKSNSTRPLSGKVRADLRPRGIQPSVLQGDVAAASHRLHHLSQIPEGTLAGGRVRRDGSHAASRRACFAEVGRAGFLDRRTSEGLWVREIRKLTDSGHQTSLISSAYRPLAAQKPRRCSAVGPRKTSSAT